MKETLKHAKHWIEYCIFIIFSYFLLSLGFERAGNFCSKVARIIGPYLPVTRIARNNIKMTLGDNNIDTIIDGLWDNYGRYIAEFVYINKLPLSEFDKRIELEGLENIQPFIDNKQPFLLCLGHFANWDFFIKFASNLMKNDISIIYRKANNPLINQAILETRQAPNIHMIAKGPSGAKKLLTALKNRHFIFMLVDQKMNDGIEVPFLGKPAMTANAIAKISLQYNHPIVPFRVIRTNGSNFKAILYPPIQYSKTEDTNTDTYNIMLIINNLLGQWVKEKPEQWFWFHNRWKK